MQDHTAKARDFDRLHRACRPIAERLEPRVMLAAGLVAAYGFDENAGGTVADASGTGNPGTISGATWTTSGLFGNALTFDGVNDLVTVADSASLDLTTALTVEAWIYPTTTTGVRDVLIKEGAGVDIYNLYARNWAGRPEANVFVGGTNRTAEGATLAANTWTHLAGTYDGSVVTLFINGVAAAATSVSGAIPASTGALRIGGNSLWGEYFQGRIDEVRVYNRALTPAEVQTDMNSAVGADVIPPAVLAMTPRNGATNVGLGSDVTITFSEPMNAATISASTIELRDPAGAVVPAVVTYNAATRVATLNPNANLATGNAYYTAVVRGGASGAKDAAGNALTADVSWAFTTGVPAFNDNVVMSGLVNPTVVRFSPDGRVFVAEKSGIIKVFDSLTDSTATTVADLRARVHNFWDRGLLGMALAPNFPTDPSIYVLYTYDGDINGSFPKFGTVNSVTDPGPDATGNGAHVSGQLARLTISGNTMVGSPTILIHDWFQQFPSHSIGSIAFGADGALYASSGDGASFNYVDSGQTGNPGGDPVNEGGALRSQDLLSSGDPTTLDGSIIRINPANGQPIYSLSVQPPTTNANGVKSYSVTSAFLGNIATTVRVLTPSNPAAVPHRVIFALPVLAGVTSTASQYSDALEELRLLDVHNRFNATIVAPSFNLIPWYADHASDPSKRLESFMVRDLVPWVNTIEPASATHERWLIGFSKSGNGALDLILRNPNLFSAAAVWDAPVQLTDMTAFPDMGVNFGTESNFDKYEIPPLLSTNGSQFKSVNRLWISGDPASWTSHMQQLHTQMQAQGILHTWVAGPARAHSWNSGWLDGAVQGLAATSYTLGNADLNAQRIVAEGFRNPFRFTFRPGTNELWVGDVGWNSWEEIDRLIDPADVSLDNFGWPAYEGAGRQSGYDGANLPLLENLYANGVVVSPYYSYAHSAQVVSGSGEPTGGSSISGLAFYGSGSYPSAYNGALFFSDYSRSRIYVMFRGPDGLPDPTNRAILPNASGPVELQIGPGGDLFYVDLGGSIHRITHTGANRAPSAVISANPTSGAVPLTVNFDGSASSDPDPGDTLAFAWDLDNDGQFDDSTSITPSFTYTTAGSKTARLRVTDGGGLTSIASIVISANAVNLNPPQVVIDLPASSLTWKVGDTINFAGHATDSEDGTLSASAFTWSLIQHHNTHTHAVQDFVGVLGGSFVAPDHEYPSYLELRVSVVDSGGLTASASVDLQPQTVNLSFATNPPGLQLVVGSTAGTTPFSRTVIVGSTNSVSAPSPQTLGGTNYFFGSWSDGQPNSHSIVAGAAPATYTATFATAAGPVASYAFEEPSGNAAIDNSGNNHSGTISGATRITTGRFGSALLFDGINDWVTVADSALLDLSTAMTLEAWVYPTTSTGTRDVLIKEGSNVDIYNLYARNSAGRPESNVYVGGSNRTAEGTTLPVNTWSHLTGTYDGATVKLFVNGVQVASTAATGSIPASAGALRIGGNSLWGEYFQGRIDEIRVYNRALSLAEIQADMAAPVAPPPVDTTPPVVAAVTPPHGANSISVSSNITVRFNEAIDPASLTGATFELRDSAGALIPATVSYSAGTLTGTLDPAANLPLTESFVTATVIGGAAGVKDLAGNPLASSYNWSFATGTPVFQNQVVINSGLTAPTVMQWLPDGRMLIGELFGKVWVVAPGANQLNPTPLLSIANINNTGVENGAESGLNGLTIDPNFASNGYIYVFYSALSPSRDRVSRFTVTGNTASLASEVVLWQNIVNLSPDHHGGGLAFGPDGKLYVSVGDQNDPASSQSLTSYHGKILRINPDGSIPADNPFYDGNGSNLDAIWARGLRNPFHFSFDSATGRMYIGDVGGNDVVNSWEDINLGVAGANYGWPLAEGPGGGAGLSDPLFGYQHSGHDAAVVGGFVYHGNAYPAALKGSYFFADYARNFIRRLTFDPAGNVTGEYFIDPLNGEFDNSAVGDPVHLTEGPDGNLYYVDIGFQAVIIGVPNSGHGATSPKIHRLVYVGSNLPPIAAASASTTVGPAPLTVNFSSAGSSDPEGVPLTYLWDFGDGTTSTDANPSHVYTSAGPYPVFLTVSDGVHNTQAPPIVINVGTPPVATISGPIDQSLFRAGQRISFSGSAFDSDEGSLPASAFSWTVVFRHDTHIHPVLGPLDGVTSGFFDIPTTGHDFSGNVRYEILLTVTDSQSLQNSTSVTIFPEKANLTFATSPAGGAITVDGIPHTGQFVLDSLIGFEHAISAPGSITIGGSNYSFASWSDGGAAAHTIVTPVVDTGYIATYSVAALPGPIASYNFEETSGSAINDISGNGNSGTLVGGRTNSGKYGRALNFTANNQMVTVPDSASLDLTTALTLEAWVYPTTNSGVRDILIKEGAGVDIYNLYHRNGAGRPEGNVFVGGTNRVAQGPASLTLNTWTHLATTYDGANLRLFVNGAQVAITPLTGVISTSSGALRIGGNSLWGEWFRGRIDDVRIYNRALSTGEIVTDMNTAVGSAAIVSDPPTGGPMPTPRPVSPGLFSGSSIKSVLDLISDGDEVLLGSAPPALPQ